MSRGILSRINWGATIAFTGLRIFFASVGLLLLIIVMGSAGEFGASLLAIPLAVLFMGVVSLVTAWLSQVGVPFAGLFSMAFGIPLFLGDPLIWLLHKIRPEWAVVEHPPFFNPPLVWVYKS